jgi:hypothetical protein
MKIEKLPKKALRYIIKKLKQEYDGTSYTEPYDVYEARDVMDVIDSIVNPFAVDIDDHYQYGFFWMLYLYNKNKSEDEDLLITVKKKLVFNVNVDVRKYTTEIYGHQTFTYNDGKGFNQSMIHSNDDFNYYDGEYIDDDTYDSDAGDWEIRDIQVYPLNESTRSSKIITEEKKRKLQILLKQREYIENEIRKLTT